MRGSRAKRLRRLIFGWGYHWPTVKGDRQRRRFYRLVKKNVHEDKRRRA